MNRVVAALIALVGLVAADECGGADWGKSGDFDFYVFAQSWSAEFCRSAGSGRPGCVSPTSFMRSNLTIHGLWPNYNVPESGHWWPQCCQSQYSATLNTSAIDPILSQLQQYWPNEQDPSGNQLSSSLWQHEWAKHGTCSGLDPDTYFRSAMKVEQIIGTLPVISQNIGGSVSRAQLESAYNNGSPCPTGGPCMVQINCDSGSILSGVTTCWSKSLQQMECPGSFLGTPPCGTHITIPSF